MADSHYTGSVPGKNRDAGLTARQQRRKREAAPHGSRLFRFAHHSIACGGAVWGAARLAGSFARSVNPHSPATSRLTAVGGRFQTSRKGANHG